MEGCCVLRGISDHPCVWKGKPTTWSRISQAQKSEVPTCSHQHLWCQSNNNRYVITVVCQTLVQTLSQENTSCSSFITVFSKKKSLLFLPFMFLFLFFFKLVSSSSKAFKNAFNSKAFLFVYETCGYVKSVESFLFHHCGACVRSWFLCLLGLCFWFCKAETVYLERGGKCVCKSVPL